MNEIIYYKIKLEITSLNYFIENHLQKYNQIK